MSNSLFPEVSNLGLCPGVTLYSSYGPLDGSSVLRNWPNQVLQYRKVALVSIRKSTGLPPTFSITWGSLGAHRALMPSVHFFH